MGAALEKYYKKNFKYPAQLSELYPEFIPNKNFITDIDWYYEPRRDNFFLSKSITRGSKQLVASIDKSSAVNLALDTINIGKQALYFVNTKRSAEKNAEDIAKKHKSKS